MKNLRLHHWLSSSSLTTANQVAQAPTKKVPTNRWRSTHNYCFSTTFIHSQCWPLRFLRRLHHQRLQPPLHQLSQRAWFSARPVSADVWDGVLFIQPIPSLFDPAWPVQAGKPLAFPKWPKNKDGWASTMVCQQALRVRFSMPPPGLGFSKHFETFCTNTEGKPISHHGKYILVPYLASFFLPPTNSCVGFFFSIIDLR